MPIVLESILMDQPVMYRLTLTGQFVVIVDIESYLVSEMCVS